TAENIYRTAKSLLTNEAQLHAIRSRLLAARTELGGLSPSKEVAKVLLDVISCSRRTSPVLLS
ncbi:MAG: hypothetical protein NZ844_12855, partial [Chloroherpetonaceae bacterium]|nr:hypothetical protein [Chloroherpetonaceae bacterium]